MTDAEVYLHVTARRGAACGSSVRSPRAAPARTSSGAVASYDEARDRAARNGYRLRFDKETVTSRAVV
jgi:hypothetical protein